MFARLDLLRILQILYYTVLLGKEGYKMLQGTLEKPEFREYLDKILPEQVVRKRSGKFQVPIMRFHRPDYDSVITLVGMVHIGDEDYYAQVQELLTIREGDGYRVLYEGVGSLSEDEEEALSANERVVNQFLEFLFRYQKFAADAMGIKWQKEALEYQDSWTRVDMDRIEVIKSACNGRERPDFIENAIRRTRNAFIMTLVANGERMLESPEGGPQVRWMMTNTNLSRLALVWNKTILRFSPLGDLFNRAIVDERNSRINDAIDNTSRTHNVIAPWGAEHLLGMKEYLLEELGCELMNAEWVDALTLGEYSWEQCTQDMKAARETCKKESA